MTIDIEQKIHLMYGCTKDDLDELIAEADEPFMGGRRLLAMSILSDAQERIAIGHGDIARQYINRAKYVINGMEK
jgi:hypothetical protein